MDYIKDLERLTASGCPWSPAHPDKLAVWDILNNYDDDCIDDEVKYGFHPDGRSGCINLNDDYLFGIRCDHLIWMTGEHEYFAGRGVLLLGNHKGILTLKYLCVNP